MWLQTWTIHLLSYKNPRLRKRIPKPCKVSLLLCNYHYYWALKQKNEKCISAWISEVTFWVKKKIVEHPGIGGEVFSSGRYWSSISGKTTKKTCFLFPPLEWALQKQSISGGYFFKSYRTLRVKEKFQMKVGGYSPIRCNSE